MIQLTRLMGEHPHEIAYDLRAWSGARIEDFPSAEVTWADLATLVRVSGATPDSALFRAINPDAPDRYARELMALDLQRHNLHALHMLAWQAGNKGKKTPSKQPELYTFPWEEPSSPGHREFDALDLESAALELGGDPRMVAAFARAMETAQAA